MLATGMHCHARPYRSAQVACDVNATQLKNLIPSCSKAFSCGRATISSFQLGNTHRSAMKPQKTAAKTVKKTTKPADTQTVSPVGFSLEPVYTALRKRYPAAGQAEAVAFAADFYKRM